MNDKWGTAYQLRSCDVGIGVFKIGNTAPKGALLGPYCGRLSVRERALKHTDTEKVLSKTNQTRVLRSNPLVNKSKVTEGASYTPYGIEMKISQTSESELLAVVDAKAAGSWTRFINHSCEPNAEFCEGRFRRYRVAYV